MKKEKKHKKHGLEREMLCELKKLETELRALRWQQSFGSCDFILPIMLMAVLGFRLSSGPWSKEGMADFQKSQKEKFSPDSTPGAQQPE